MMNIFLNLCALVVVILIIKSVWSSVTEILSGKKEREDLRKKFQYLREENKNLRAKVLLFHGLGVCPLDNDRVELVFADGSITLDSGWRFVALKSNPPLKKEGVVK